MSLNSLTGKEIQSIVQDDEGTIFSFTDGSFAQFFKSGEWLIEPKEHLCNFCGETCALSKTGDDFGGLIDTVVSGGYHSTPGNGYGALDDCTSYTFSLCEFCLDHIFSQFKIKPDMGSFAGGEEKIFYPAKERVAEDDWRKMKDVFNKEYEHRLAMRNK